MFSGINEEDMTGIQSITIESTMKLRAFKKKSK